METIIIHTRNNISKFRYHNDEWFVETLYKEDKKIENEILKKEEEKFFRFVAGNKNFNIDYQGTQDLKEELPKHRLKDQSKPKAKARPRSQKTTLAEIKEKTEIE